MTEHVLTHNTIDVIDFKSSYKKNQLNNFHVKIAKSAFGHSVLWFQIESNREQMMRQKRQGIDIAFVSDDEFKILNDLMAAFQNW